MLRDDIIKVLEIVAVFLGDNRADDVEVFSRELRVVHQLSLSALLAFTWPCTQSVKLCSKGISICTRPSWRVIDGAS